MVNGQHGPGTAGDPIPAQREGSSTATPPPAPAPAVGTPLPVPVASAIPGPAAPRRRKGRVLLILAIVVASLVVLGGVAGVVVYGQATKIDRSTPVVSADAFLNAVAVESDAARAGLYTCARWPGADAFSQTTRLLDPEARTTWDSFMVVSQSGSEAVLQVRMRFRYAGEVAPSGEKLWRLSLVNESGWRVCAVTQVE